MERFNSKEKDENLTEKATTRGNRTGWNVNKGKRGDRVGVNGFEPDKPVRNEAE